MLRRQAIGVLAPIVAVLAAACTSGPGSIGPPAGGQEPGAPPGGTPLLSPTALPLPTPAPTSTLIPVGADLPRPYYAGTQWKTDFSKHSVKYSEIISAGPRRDEIPPIDAPEFFLVSDVPNYMPPEWPVVSLDINGETRAYPLAILIWHEIVNDVVGGVPVTVTYCPLCNTAIVFDRTVDGRALDFGTSGLLRKSDLVMWDRQTESWWQQITGEAIVGALTGARLPFIPAQVVSWSEYKEAAPGGLVLSMNTGFQRAYGGSPYPGYDSERGIPLWYTGNPDRRLAAMERVVGLTVGDEKVAYPFTLLQDRPVVHDVISGKELVIFYDKATLSPFMRIGADDYHPVGSTGVFEPFAGGRRLTFEVRDGKVTDDETGSTWNIFGLAVDGPLAGDQLAPLVHANHFWFAWAGFYPDTSIRTAQKLE